MVRAGSLPSRVTMNELRLLDLLDGERLDELEGRVGILADSGAIAGSLTTCSASPLLRSLASRLAT